MLSSIMAAPVCVPTNSTEDSSFSIPARPANTCDLDFLIPAVLLGVRWNLTVALICDHSTLTGRWRTAQWDAGSQSRQGSWLLPASLVCMWNRPCDLTSLGLRSFSVETSNYILCWMNLKWLPLGNLASSTYGCYSYSFNTWSRAQLTFLFGKQSTWKIPEWNINSYPGNSSTVLNKQY